MKKTYEKPEIQVVDFQIEDIITTSGAGNSEGVIDFNEFNKGNTTI